MSNTTLDIINEIIGLYSSGNGSTTISKMLNFPEQKILKIIHNAGIMRNRYHSDEFYSNFWEEDGKWWGYWKCDTCNKDIKFSVNKKCLLNRNIKKKKTCKKCSLKKQIGEGNPFYGKTHSEETISQISESRTGKYTGNDNHMKNPEFIKKFTHDLRDRWANGDYDYLRPFFKENMIKTRLEGKLKSFCRSKAEDELITIIKNYGLEVVPNYRIESKIFDIYIPKYNLLIEYNGDYWHCNPKKYSSDYFNHKKNKTAKEMWEYDEAKLYLAKKNGYNCEVIWESDYKKDKSIILEIIKNYE